MANRYDKPVNYAYVSQYVPIPFQELVTLGQHYANERKQAEKDLANYVQKVGEFNSLISKDNESYRNIALNSRIQKRINEATQDPSVMKSSAWRSGLMSDLNSVDYVSLSKLKASAEQADLYNKMAKQLAMEGKLPPGWEPDYFSNYSTVASGIFNATPLPYESMVDRIKPYVDNLKDSYLSTDGQYDYYGVDEATIANQIKAFKSDILSNPSNKRDIQRYVSNGMSLQDATDLILTQANTAALEYKRRTREINPFAQINAKATAAAIRSGNINGAGVPGVGNGWFTNALTQTGQMTHSQLAQEFIREAMPDKYKEWSDAITKASLPNATAEEKAAGEKAKKEANEQMKKIGYSDTYNYLFDSAASSIGDTDGDLYSVDQATIGANAVAMRYGKPVGEAQYDKISSRTRGLSTNTKETDFGKTKTINGANNLNLQVAALSDLTGFQIADSGLINSVNNALQSGAFGELIPTGSNYVMGIPQGDNSINFYGQSVAIDAKMVTPKKEGEKTVSGITADQLLRLGAQVRIVTDTPYEQKSVKYDDDGNEIPSSNTKGAKKPRMYYILQVVNDLPSTGSGFDAHYLNQDIIQTEMTGSQSGKKQLENYNNSIIDDE